MPYTYPPARKGDQTDDYHGVSVADPYRWLEDVDSPETRLWIDAENKITLGFLEAVSERTEIRERLTALWDYEKFGLPYRKGDRYFYSRNDGLQNQSVLYVTPSLDDPGHVLLDPNTLSPDGTVALSGYALSEDGRRMAYGLSAAGSDWQEWRVRDVETGEDLGDRLEWVKFSGASWTHDGAGFFYSRYDAPVPGAELQQANYFQKLCYHRLGTSQEEDRLVYERPDQKEWGFNGHVTEDGQYLIISVWQGTERKNRVFFQDLSIANGPKVELLSEADAGYGFVGSDGPLFWFWTDRDAPHGRLIAIDTRRPDPTEWCELIPEAPETLQGVSAVGGHLVASYLQDAHALVRVFARDGVWVRDVSLPGLGTISGFGGRQEQNETFYAYTSFTTPTTIYRYDVATGESRLFRRPQVAFDSNDYETRQVFFPSKDGTHIPMYLSYKTGLPLNGANPTYLVGYGGFNISLTPAFSPSNLVWMEQGGILAVPNLRGGGEYGEDWHLAGTKLRKQNVFDDFLSAAQWLIDNHYTSTPKLAIGGGSNGGLLVGACLTQRPDLFGAAVPEVGVLDMLRFPKFTIGWGWVSDYGSPDDPAEFQALYAYSPLHNIKPQTAYPPTLILTSDHDDRVVPAHSFKFAAALQAAQAGEAPIIIRIETQAGHGAGKPTAKIIESMADKWAFLTRVLGKNPQPTL